MRVHHMTDNEGVHAPGGSGEQPGSNCRTQMQTALDVLEIWIDELRNALQPTMRESAEHVMAKGRACLQLQPCKACTGY
jgi:hypothetical protein